MRRKLHRERTIWSRLRHPNVLPLYGFADDLDVFQPFGALISPWRPQGNACEFLKARGKDMSPAQRLDLWIKVIAGVGYLHNHQPVLIHGDLKSANILIDNNNNPQICDFGLISIFLEEGSSGMTTTSPHTGTDRYLAYELVLGGEKVAPTTASDIFALGCIGLEFYFLQVPYAHRKHNMRGEIFLDIRAYIPPATRTETTDELDIAVWTFLDGCWSRNPDDRFEAQVLHQLMTYAHLDHNISVVPSSTNQSIDLSVPAFRRSDQSRTAPATFSRPQSADIPGLKQQSNEETGEPVGVSSTPYDSASPVAHLIETYCYATQGPTVQRANATPTSSHLIRRLCLQCHKAQCAENSVFCGPDCVSMSRNGAPKLLELPAAHYMFRRISDLFKGAWKHPTAKPTPQHIFVIVSTEDNDGMYKAYRNRVEALRHCAAQGMTPGNEQYRWYGTTRECKVGDPGQGTLCTSTSCPMCSIIRSSFEVDKFASRWGRFGKGIYTSSTSSKSNDYSRNLFQSQWTALLLNSVVVGNPYSLYENASETFHPPPGYDSIIGQPGPVLNYDETVVYRNDAIRPVYLVLYLTPRTPSSG